VTKRFPDNGRTDTARAGRGRAQEERRRVMKRLYMTAYRYRQNLREEDLRHLTKKFAELGTAPGVLAHYERLDGMGGFMIEDVSQENAERSYELTLRYTPWVEMEVFPITTIEEAFPVIQRVYG